MKTRFIFLLLILLSISTANSQIKENGLNVEFNISTDSRYSGNNFTILSPSIGYKFNSKFNLGFRMKYEVGDMGYFTHYVPFLQYYFLHNKKIDIFIEAQPISIATSDLDGGQSGYTECGFQPGLNLNLSRNIYLTARYMFIGYNDCNSRRNKMILGNGRFIIDAGRFFVGAGIIL